MHQNTLGCESRSVFLKLCPALCLFVCECVVTGHRHALVDFAFSRLDPLRSSFAHTVIISVFLPNILKCRFFLPLLEVSSLTTLWDTDMPKFNPSGVDMNLQSGLTLVNLMYNIAKHF